MDHLTALFWRMLGDNHGQPKREPRAIVVVLLLVVVILLLVIIVTVTTLADIFKNDERI